MLSGKRKQGLSGLQRRVRPRREAEPEVDEHVSSEPEEMDEDGDELSEGEEDEMDQDDEDQESDGSPPPKKSNIDISSVSFGALAKAQASMPAPNKRRKKGAEPSDSEPDSDSGPEEVGRKPKYGVNPAKRTSKHAPMEQSSKKPVSRRREVIAVPKMEVRDPRFDPLSGPIDEAKARKAYAFLDDYRKDEMRELRAEIKKTKDADKKEEMKRLLLSMESKIKTRERKQREADVISEHKRKEKELVKQGKQPFYLKKSEQKKRFLMDQFAGMKKKQVDRTIERKRKKVVGRERKELDQLQRRPRE
ncbi:rRNA biogenesis protein rrp5 [Colletotrichum spaethianum]|uniref:rRNA biogenesis protein RRP36 n=1 Tax=Colletotrichum spaethianum TaxID=700344 RepID=A0AA37PBS9_9PEZI|nr:rRNA biogenesis protein rrp5 [Colletotrichum spaethianum]GKT49317.1 rRNA biogenesis protein rrp5 [Colletotrichum spaethianum]